MGCCPGVPESQTQLKRLSTHAHKNHGAGGGGAQNRANQKPLRVAQKGKCTGRWTVQSNVVRVARFTLT